MATADPRDRGRPAHRTAPPPGVSNRQPGSPTVEGPFTRLVNVLRFEFWRLRDALSDRVGGAAHPRAVFSRIYAGNLWGERTSVSGGGSGPAATPALRRQLPILFHRYA